MKLTSLIQRSLVGVACMGFMLGTAAGGTHKLESKNKGGDLKQQYLANRAGARPKVIFVDVTGSRIPQRVVLSGQQVNSGSPLYVVQYDELNRTGATDVAGMLALDPSIFRTRR